MCNSQFEISLFNKAMLSQWVEWVLFIQHTGIASVD